jgi:pyruvate kinase
MSLHYGRKTKIICTIGPATSSMEMIVKLIEAGMDVARLNFSHGAHEEHQQVMEMLHEASLKTGKNIGILQDLAGPKIRLGTLSKPSIKLEHGQKVILFSGDHSDSDEIPVNYPYLAEEVAPGRRILLADGLVELEVEKVESGKLICIVLNEGELSSNKGVNMPLTQLRIPAFTDKDKVDLEFGLKMGVDFVALSFVRDEKDLKPIIDILDKHDNPPMLLAKIEKPQAIESLDQIIDKVGGVMVARGDLGVEVPLEQLPFIQKRIISASRRAAMPVITATQMLRSMIDNPRPTRAETTDIANAILDGTSAIMLSEETAVGSYPVESVKVMDQIARTAEKHIESRRFLNEDERQGHSPVASSISRAACNLSSELNAVCIAVTTNSGSTARLVSRFRPEALILGMTADERAFKRMSINWGVVPVLIPPHVKELDEISAIAVEFAKKHDLAKSGDKVILTSGYPSLQTGNTDMVKTLTVE